MSTSYLGSVVVSVKPKKDEKFPPAEIMYLKFFSADLDEDGNEKVIKCKVGILPVLSDDPDRYKLYTCQIGVPNGFGEIGGVIVELQEDVNERFIDTISIKAQNSVTFSCKSWVQPKRVINNQRRIFFSSNKSYLSGKTPPGLVNLRKEDLVNLRGDGNNERKEFERIYDYDVYNDLGDPDLELKWKRPVLGDSEVYPYPRRCRTGRPRCTSDGSSEQRFDHKKFYVPRDEQFAEVKQQYYPPTDPKNKYNLSEKPFFDLYQIESIFKAGIELPSNPSNFLQFDILSSILSPNSDSSVPVTPLRLPPSEHYNRDKFNWLSDTEFARQTLAGLNPYSIQLVEKLPFMSELDPAKYGSPQSKFTKTKVGSLLGCSIQEVDKAIEDKRLFVLDYHDILMQYVIKVREIKNKTLYGSRTLLFLQSNGTLMPLGIELTKPPMDGNPQWKNVFSPSTDPTKLWLWRFAKAHVLSHDACIHQVVTHWLRTHCCMEPYAIATNRQLSTMHPIYRLLHPHFRYNMAINSNAREGLIAAGGIIEATFSTASYSMELSSLVYKKEWRFDKQSLPEDLIHRGMAKKKEGGGVELTIKDYPFANDGLILWDALLKWVTTYVNHYYGGEPDVVNDEELQAWWKEIQIKGHPDKNEGWPSLETKEDLIKIVSTIAWVGSGHHSAINFIQYAYGGYIPNRPSIARTDMLTEDFDHQLLLDQDHFINQPEKWLLQLFPSIEQGSIVMKALILLSAHSLDEEYIGDEIEPAWALESSIRIAFEKFQADLKVLEEHIDKSNKNAKLKNRHGDGVMPYDVLKPRSTPGVTGKGVPYSVSA